MNVIQTENVTRRFGNHTAVDNLSLTIQQGEVFGFLGHNGAGKTTTVRLLNGVLQPDSGKIEVLGMTPGPELRTRTGVLTETPSVDERLTARDNLSIFGEIYGIPHVSQRVDDLLKLFDLSERANEKVGGYSKGMKQRLALARALLHQPELLFLDEPTSGLDPVSARQVHDLIQHASREQGHTVFLTTHNLNEAQRLCDRVAVTEQGRMVAIGTPAQLASEIGMALRFEIEIAPETLQNALSIINGRYAAENPKHNTLLVTLKHRDAMPELLAELMVNDVRVYQVVQQEASLEDIYFALQGAKS